MKLSDRLVVERSSALPLVSVSAVLRAGALHDPLGAEGSTSLLTRLMRRTGGGLDAHALDVRIESLGGALGVDVGHHSIRFVGQVIGRRFDDFVEVLVDVMARASLAEEERGRLLRAAKGELIAALDNDRGLARGQLRKSLYNGHPYQRATSGTVRSVEQLDGATLEAQRDRLFRNGELLVAVSGDVAEGQAERLQARLMEALPAGHAPALAVPEPTLEAGRRLVIVDKPARSQTQILIGTLGTHPDDEDHVALHVASTVLGGAFTSRLMKAVRSERGWSYGAYSSLPIGPTRQSFSLWTFPKADDAAACLALKLELLERWVTDGITADELAWAQNYIVRSNAFTVDTASKRAALGLEERVLGLKTGYYAGFPEAVQQVTLEQANAAIRRRIDPSRLELVVVGTAEPLRAALEAAIPGLSSTQVVRFDADP